MTENDPLIIERPVLALVGPTAIGKTSLSLELSTRFTCEIISVDSMQVYRYMDIGTAKASREERQRIPHHLIDIVEPDDAYNSARFVVDSMRAIEMIHSRGAVPLLTGGTGLYLAALKNGLFEAPPTDPSIRDDLRMKLAEEGSGPLHEQLRLHDPQSAARIHPNDSSRIVRALELYLATGTRLSDFLKNQASRPSPQVFKNFHTIGLNCERSVLYTRINERSELLFEWGLEDEVRALLDKGFSPQLPSMQSIGYRHMINYIEGRWDYAQCVELLARDTRHYAKRQFTWFNRDDSIEWFDRGAVDPVFESVDRFLKGAR